METREWLSPRLKVAVGALGAVALLAVWVGSERLLGPDESAVSGTPRDPPPSPSPSEPIAPPASSCPPGMQSIPAGTFTMGSDDGADDERPAHRVPVSAFCVDRTEVTVGAYADCVRWGRCTAARTHSEWCNGARADRLTHPVNCVDWNQATAYCRAVGGRLPTEREWEYAARGTDGRTYPWGNQAPDHTRLNAIGPEARSAFPTWNPMYPGNDGHVGTAPVGSYAAGASPFGVLDLAGNVWEWVSDEYGPYPGGVIPDEYLPYPGEPPLHASRGGSWGGIDAARVRATVRFGHESPNYFVGFRCARGG